MDNTIVVCSVCGKTIGTREAQGQRNILYDICQVCTYKISQPPPGSHKISEKFDESHVGLPGDGISNQTGEG